MKRADWRKLLTGCLILTLFFVGTAAAADEIPPLPAQYYGTVLSDGNPVTAGTVVIAKIGDTEVGRLTLTEAGKLGGSGTFEAKLLAGPATADAEGKEITFWIGEIKAAETSTFKSGAAESITLTFVGVPVQPTTSTTTSTSTPTATATGSSSGGGSSGESSTGLPTQTQGTVTPTGQTQTQTQTPAPGETSGHQGTGTTNPTVPTGTVQTVDTTTTTQTPTATQTRQAPVPLAGILAGLFVALSLRSRKV